MTKKHNSEIISDGYHDYVFKDGELVGRFDDMYCHSKEIPWHQDKTADRLFVDLDISIIKHFIPKFNIKSLCDIGCGLGYVTARLHDELAPHIGDFKVTGLDISPEATRKAKQLHPDLEFFSANIMTDNMEQWRGQFDFIYMKDVLWYVCQDADGFIDKVVQLLRNGGLYVLQSVPDSKEFIGSDVFPTTFSIADFLSERFEPVYISSTYEVDTARIIGDYAKDKYLRFLGKKS